MEGAYTESVTPARTRLAHRGADELVRLRHDLLGRAAPATDAPRADLANDDFLPADLGHLVEVDVRLVVAPRRVEDVALDEAVLEVLPLLAGLPLRLHDAAAIVGRLGDGLLAIGLVAELDVPERLVLLADE